MFRLYDCGCIGFTTNATVAHGKRVRCIKACCHHGAKRRFAFFEMSAWVGHALQNRGSHKLADEEIEKLFDELADLAVDAYALHELRASLRAAGIG